MSEARFLDEEEVALSASRAFAWACGAEPVPWEFLAPEAQLRWRRVARRGERLLEAHQGKNYAQAARPLFELAHGSGPPEDDWAAPTLRVAWEAVTRHLVTLFDSDEVADVDALERSWADWAKKKREVLNGG